MKGYKNSNREVIIPINQIEALLYSNQLDFCNNKTFDCDFIGIKIFKNYKLTLPKLLKKQIDKYPDINPRTKECVLNDLKKEHPEFKYLTIRSLDSLWRECTPVNWQKKGRRKNI